MIMARDAGCEMQVALSCDAGCAAAIGLFYRPRRWLFAGIKGGEVRVLDAVRTRARRPWKAAAALLKIVNRRNRFEFLVSEDGRR